MQHAARIIVKAVTAGREQDARETLAAAKARCEAARWPEQHRDDCAWCAHVLAARGPL